MTTNPTSLDQFELAQQPTSIDELTTNSPAKVIEKYSDIERFQSNVQINDHNKTYLVGSTVEPDLYRLYHDPMDPKHTGLAGFLGLEKYPRPPVVGFLPAGDSPDDETAAETVTSISVDDRPQFDHLDSLINHIKSEITGYDWTENGRADTARPDWRDATLTLISFYEEHYSDPSFNINMGFLQGSTEHGIARHPTDAGQLLSMAATRLDRLEGGDEEHNRYNLNPFGLETLLLDYASENLSQS
jgi:hypothetical protein